MWLTDLLPYIPGMVTGGLFGWYFSKANGLKRKLMAVEMRADIAELKAQVCEERSMALEEQLLKAAPNPLTPMLQGAIAPHEREDKRVRSGGWKPAPRVR